MSTSPRRAPRLRSHGCATNTPLLSKTAVWLLLDNECNQRHTDSLHAHLNNHNHCLTVYDSEAHLTKLLARKCGGERAPEMLRARLREQLRAAGQPRSTE